MQIFDHCQKQDAYKSFITNFLYHDVLNKGPLCLKDIKLTGSSSVVDYFQNEGKAHQGINPYHMRFFVNYLIKNQAELLFENKNSISNIFNMSLLFALTFNKDKNLTPKLLKLCLKLIKVARESVEKSDKDVKSGAIDGLI